MTRTVKVPTNIYDDHSDGFYGMFQLSVGKKKKKKVDWNSCRELFHDGYSGNRKIFLFAAHGKNTGRVRAFIRRADAILGLGPKYRCRFATTNLKGVMAVRPGPFWCGKKRSELLTILLRAAQYYEETKNTSNKNFWFACEKEDYLKRTWSAFLRFMSGSTNIVLRPTEPFDGWVSEFSESFYQPRLVASKTDKKRAAAKKALRRRK